jgi:hypothetical protein
MVLLEFFIDIILPAAQCSWCDSASNRNGYQEHFLGVKAAGGSTVVKVLRYKSEAAGSIPDGVVEFFIDINTSDRTMALESTQPLTEMSTRRISWG